MRQCAGQARQSAFSFSCAAWILSMCRITWAFFVSCAPLSQLPPLLNSIGATATFALDDLEVLAQRIELAQMPIDSEALIFRHKSHNTGDTPSIRIPPRTSSLPVVARQTSNSPIVLANSAVATTPSTKFTEALRPQIADSGSLRIAAQHATQDQQPMSRRALILVDGMPAS